MKQCQETGEDGSWGGQTARSVSRVDASKRAVGDLLRSEGRIQPEAKGTQRGREKNQILAKITVERNTDVFFELNVNRHGERCGIRR